jgi:Na+/phosphate symporter
MSSSHLTRDRLILLAKCLGIAVCLYLFIVAIGGMSHAFQLFDKGFSDEILKTASSPFVGLSIGILANALVQSSSATTSVIVGVVAAGGRGLYPTSSEVIWSRACQASRSQG